MAILNLFSKRQRMLKGEVNDVYVYEDMPQKLRIQIFHIINDTLGINYLTSQDQVGSVYESVVSALLREYGWTKLSSTYSDDYRAIQDYFFNVASYDQALDLTELFFSIIDNAVRQPYYREWTRNRRLTPDEAISDLNHRFKENGVGYQFESGRLIRLDSEFLHSEAIKPALNVLSDKRLKGANDEFLSAHSHYREQRYEECLVDCYKAFESTMKSICAAKKWEFKQTDSAKGLITICVNNGLFPSYLESQITSLRTLFESGIPTVRNKVAGHGKGTEQRSVPEHYTRYVLNLTATTILFLAELGFKKN